MVSLGHAAFLTVALVTHVVVGYTLGAALFDRPWAGAVAGVAADVDLLVPAAWGAPFVHRGLTHTALAAGAAVGVGLYWGRSTAGAVGAGYASQLLVDVTTPQGVPLAYPFRPDHVVVPLHGHSPTATVLLWLMCLVLLWWDGRIPTPRVRRAG